MEKHYEMAAEEEAEKRSHRLLQGVGQLNSWDFLVNRILYSFLDSEQSKCN